MSKFTSIEQMEQNAQLLREMAAKAGAETWEDRKKNQTPQCKFGEDGICCRICSMGPCRITPKASRGICGADAHAIAARNYVRFIAGGTAAHSDHGREIAHVLHVSSRDGNYIIKDEQKLLNLAREWGVATEGRDIYDIAHEVAEIGLMEYGKPFGTLRFLERATEERRKLWEELEIAPRAIDREIATVMHMTHMGCSADAEALVMQGLRTGMSDGWGGSMMGTEFSDILFGTPTPKETEADLGVLEKDMVNIIIHGHDPAMSEMIVAASNQSDLIEYAKENGARGINIAGLCCTGNEITMRHGVKIAGNFLQQEGAILTGAVELIVVDVQCIFPALGPLTKCFHTKFITTSEITRIPGSEFIKFEPIRALDQAREIVKMAIDNFKNRGSNICIPQSKQKAVVGYSCEAIIKRLDTVTNSHVDDLGTYKPLVECLESGVLRGAVGIVGCNNPKVRPDYSHIEIIKELLRNDIIVVATGCSAQAAAKAGLMQKEAKELCGAGLKRVCELADIPPVLHMGSCVDISRILMLVTGIAKAWNVDIPKLPIVGCAPEWMSEKAVSIANYVVATGIDTYLGIEPQVKGSSQMMELITEGTRKLVGAGYIINTDPNKLVASIIEGIEAKRAALGI
ncbi:MAG TPA: anaerobic carbon-monoxide dehydrogenase catalytic subunit [Clostridiales bacterium]|nr:anaerobic carbon-monoxide dehydrogenase catalytic subunit [Clostridiales bacterium]